MKAEEKLVLARFLDLSSDFLASGYRQNRDDYVFNDNHKPALPLAYTIEESEDNDSESIDGEGSQNPLVMVIGEGPGEEEETTGRTFAGNAGQLLDRMLASIGLYRSKNCFIAGLNKCRPPENRGRELSETAACYPFLERQILLLRPLLILCMGQAAAQGLLKTSEGIDTLRGKFTEIKIAETVIPVLPTFHPDEILKDNRLKGPAWEDLLVLHSRLASMNKEYAAAACAASSRGKPHA